MLPALLTLLLLVASTNCEQHLAFAAAGDWGDWILRDGRVPTPTFPAPGPVMSNLLLPPRHNPGVPAPGHLLPQRPIPSVPAPGPENLRLPQRPIPSVPSPGPENLRLPKRPIPSIPAPGPENLRLPKHPIPSIPSPGPENLRLPQRPIPSVPAPGPVVGHHLLSQLSRNAPLDPNVPSECVCKTECTQCVLTGHCPACVHPPGHFCVNQCNWNCRNLVCHGPILMPG